MANTAHNILWIMRQYFTHGMHPDYEKSATSYILKARNDKSDCRTLYVRQKAKRGEIQPYLKTQNGGRDIDLCTTLAGIFKEHIGNRTSGLLFSTSTGNQISQRNILRDSLHPILEKLEHEQGGFNIFRRFRLTWLDKSDCPESLEHFWSGHAQTHVSERYKKWLKEREHRLEWAERIGMGFDLPARLVAPLAPLIKFRKAHYKRAPDWSRF